MGWVGSVGAARRPGRLGWVGSVGAAIEYFPAIQHAFLILLKHLGAQTTSTGMAGEYSPAT